MFKVVNLREYKEVIERYASFSIKFIRVTDTEATLYIVKWNNYFIGGVLQWHYITSNHKLPEK